MPIEPAFVEAFSRTVSEAAQRLLAMSDTRAGAPRAPGEWSRKEIIGHLIDSAANNHARFVRAQATDDLLFESYDADEWVRVQRYKELPWEQLVMLWRDYNRHLARVIASADPGALDRPRARHNLDQVAFRPTSPGEPATLAYFMRDYVAHLEHHLQQVFEP
jgi:hypothetical protein